MMQNIKAQLKDAQKRQQEVVAQISTLDQQRQLLLQEALRLDGELRLLKRMDGDEKPADTPIPEILMNFKAVLPEV